MAAGVCRFYGSKSGCRFGKSCRFQHVEAQGSGGDLTSLRVAKKPLSEEEEHFEEWLDNVDRVMDLTFAHLEPCDFSREELTRAAVALGASEVEEFVSRGQGLTEDGLALLINEGFRKNKSLVKIELAENRCGDMAAFFAFLHEQRELQLSELQVWQNDNISAASLDILSKCLKAPAPMAQTLEKLNLSRVPATLPAMGSLATALAGSNVRELVWQHNPLIGEEAQPFFAWLASPGCRLTKLDLTYASISFEGFSAALAANRSLQELVLDRTVTNWAASLLAPALAAHPSLRRLSLQYCMLNDDGGVPIVRALQNNTVLTSLLFHEAFVDNLTGAALKKLLATNPTLTELTLTRTYMSAELQQECLALLKR